MREVELEFGAMAIDEAVWKILEGKRKAEIEVVDAVTVTHTNEAAAITNAALQRWIQGEAAGLNLRF